MATPQLPLSQLVLHLQLFAALFHRHPCRSPVVTLGYSNLNPILVNLFFHQKIQAGVDASAVMDLYH